MKKGRANENHSSCEALSSPPSLLHSPPPSSHQPCLLSPPPSPAAPPRLRSLPRYASWRQQHGAGKRDERRRRIGNRQNLEVFSISSIGVAFPRVVSSAPQPKPWLLLYIRGGTKLCTGLNARDVGNKVPPSSPNSFHQKNELKKTASALVRRRASGPAPLRFRGPGQRRGRRGHRPRCQIQGRSREKAPGLANCRDEAP